MDPCVWVLTKTYVLQVVNSGFDVLKVHVPHLKNKVSKVETLRYGMVMDQ
jgi:hypothetical protein